ncbi:MAG: SPOR domain-containing protein, partial [Bacteriodetes bacterium]|nr:SPOR domain-containing protein [Bacteroidota bacterium]
PKSKAIDIAPTTDDKKQPEKTTPATNAKANAAGSAGKKWGLQIGVYSTRQTAEDEAKKYSEQKLRVEIVDKGDSKFAVIIGNYNTRESAEKSKEVVQAQCQCTPYIMEK